MCAACVGQMKIGYGLYNVGRRGLYALRSPRLVPDRRHQRFLQKMWAMARYANLTEIARWACVVDTHGCADVSPPFDRRKCQLGYQMPLARLAKSGH